MSSEQGAKPGSDEQIDARQSPVEREIAGGDDGGEAARNAAGIAGLSFGAIIVGIFILFVIVLLGFIIANAL